MKKFKDPRKKPVSKSDIGANFKRLFKGKKVGKDKSFGDIFKMNPEELTVFACSTYAPHVCAGAGSNGE